MFMHFITVRPAAALSGAATTDPINIRGASMVVFYLKATDAGQLSTCKVQTSLDGTNFIDAGSASAPAKGNTSMLAETGAGTTIAMNAGGVAVAAYPSSPSMSAPYAADYKARLSVTPSTTVAGLEVVACAFYETKPETLKDQQFGVI